MDKVFIEGLEIEALIGIYDWERRIRQPLRFDLEMAFDNRVPAASDAIADTLDYKAVSKRLIAFVSQSDFGLVETLAERCAEIVLREFNVASQAQAQQARAVRGANAVGVIIKRSRECAARSRGRRRAVTLPPAIAALPAARPAAQTQVQASSVPSCQAYLSLGSNIEPENNLRIALAALRARFGDVVVSPVYRTARSGSRARISSTPSPSSTATSIRSRSTTGCMRWRKRRAATAATRPTATGRWTSTSSISATWCSTAPANSSCRGRNCGMRSCSSRWPMSRRISSTRSATRPWRNCGPRIRSTTRHRTGRLQL